MLIATRQTPVFNKRVSSMLSFLRRESDNGKKLLHIKFTDLEVTVISHLHLTGAIQDTDKGIMVEKP